MAGMAAAPDFHITTDQVVDLVGIYQPEIQLCQWEPVFCREREAYGNMLAEQAFGLANVVDIQGLDDVLAQCPEGRGSMIFKTWLKGLVEVFMDLFELDKVGLRIHTSDKPMCPKLHFDQVPARLIHPLNGDGCEWLDARNYDIKAGLTASDLKDFCPDGKDIHKAPPGSVVIMKGSKWSEATPPVVHRSPSHNQARAVLTIDFA